MSSAGRPDVWVGRDAELALFASAVDLLADGRGSMVWVEGEPGIGKSSLVTKGMSAAGARGCEVLSATADQLSQRLPLQVTLDCLGVRPHSPDPRRAQIAQLMRDRRPGVFAVDDVVSSTAELLVALVDELCSESPTAIVVDDLQWADDASLVVWHRMAFMVDQLPLLLVGVSRRGSRRDQVRELRAAVRRRRGQVISLQPLGQSDVAALVTGLTGAPPGPGLTRLAEQAMGNPLYLGELIGALARERDGDAEQPDREPSADQLDRVPASFAAALDDRLNLVPEGSADILKAAVLLGGEFAVTDLAVVLRRPPSELAVGLHDAVAAGVIVDVGSRLAFRHPLIQRAIYESMPATLRQALHNEAAQALAAAGAEQLRVAQQLLLAAQPGDGWARSWLAEAAPTLAAVAPDMAAELLQRALDHARPDDGNRDALAVALARVLLGMGRYEEAVARARQALTIGVKPDRRPEMYWVLARALFCLGDNEAAGDAVARALAQPDLPDRWRARLLGTRAMFQRAGAGDVDAADTSARQALDSAGNAEDPFATAYALIDLWLIHSVRRDHATALHCLDRALAVLGDGPDYADLRAFAFDGRVFTMQNLDRWPDAEQTLRHAHALAHRLRHPGTAASNVTAAVLFYWLGRWDDALAELITSERDAGDVTYSGLRERGPNLLRHGVAALIAGRRDERLIAEEHLHKGLKAPILTIGDRENQDFLLAAQALAFEQSGDLSAAVQALSPILARRPGEMTLTHQWLPFLTRLAIAAGDSTTALAAVRTCRAEAEAESTPARAAVAALRCDGLLAGDPALLRRAVMHYRAVGPMAELGSTLEDLAAVLADHGATEDAKKALNEAIALYGDVGAKWDIRRAEHRLRGYGVRRGIRGPRPKRATYGWEALTPTELKIAGFVAEGLSTPAIAQRLYLSRRTVQTHISHIITKLGLRCRVDIAREALRRRSDP
jgi:DNA-binding CsgD family transcriptional regulator